MTIAEALATLSVPVTHPPYLGEGEDYITYQLITQSTTLYAEGVEAETSVLYSVDLYTKTVPFAPMLLKIKELLQAGGWSCTVAAEQYENDTGLYHISMDAAAVGGIYG